MKNIKVCVSPDVQEKLLYKHGIGLDELKDSLIYGKPRIFRQEKKTYLAITHHLRYLTIIFEYTKPAANIITAYPSSESQIRRYKKK